MPTDLAAALHTALDWGRFNELASLLDQGANPDSRDRRGDTVLAKAAKMGSCDVVSMLLTRGADLNLTNDSSGWTPLMVAAYNGREKVARLLLENGADPEIRNRSGDTARELCSKWGRQEALAWLDEECGDRAPESDSGFVSEEDLSRSWRNEFQDSDRADTEAPRSPEPGGWSRGISQCNNHIVWLDPCSFNAFSRPQGDVFELMANLYLRRAGFDLLGKAVYGEIGVEVDQRAKNKEGITVYFEFKGSVWSNRPGMMRTDTAKKALNNARSLHQAGFVPFVILTSHFPGANTAAYAQIQEAKRFADVICLFDVKEVSRLQRHYLTLDQDGLADWRAGVGQSPDTLEDAVPTLLHVDLREPVLLMIECEGGRFYESSDWEVIKDYLDVGSPLKQPPDGRPVDTRGAFLWTLQHLTKTGLVNARELKDSSYMWELTEAGHSRLRLAGLL